MKIFICILALVATAISDEAGLEETLRNGNNAFSAKMFSEVVKENKGKSVVMSAFSLLQPLALLGLASVGESHDQLMKAIGLPDDNAIKEVFPIINGQLKSVKGVELKLANKLYIPLGEELNEEFSNVSRSVFDSEVKNVDFTKSVETANEINTWVEDQTNHRIKDLVNSDNLDVNTRVVLVNAIYFKGSWENKFQPLLTRDREFHVTKDKTVKIPTMYKEGQFNYGESKELDAKLLEIFYDGRESSFLIVLPNEIDGIEQLEEKLKVPSVLDKAIEEMTTTDVNVHLPKFKIETKTNLRTVLTNIGVEKIFDASNAKLEKLLKNNKGLYVTDATQKAFIEVNEEGAEAAAANSFGIAYLSAYIPKLQVFDANHPFVFFLREKRNTLFSGVFQS